MQPKAPAKALMSEQTTGLELDFGYLIPSFPCDTTF